MTVYFQGAEREDMVLSGQDAITYSGGNSNNRCTMRVAGSAATTWMESTPFSSNAFWTHFALNRDEFGDNTTANVNAEFYSGSSSVIGIQYKVNYVAIKYWNGSSWTTATSTTAFNVYAGIVVFDVYIKIGTSGTGEIRVYCNGTPACFTNSVDTTFSGTVTNITKVRWHSGSLSTGNAGQSFYYDFIIADWCTIGARLLTLAPNGAGNYNAWSGAGYTSVDERDPDTLFMTSNTVDQRFSTSFANVASLAAGESIASVKMTGAFARDLAGPQSVDFFTRIGTTDYDGTDQTVPTATNANSSISQYWVTSPATSNSWTLSELNAAEFGLRSRT